VTDHDGRGRAGDAGHVVVLGEPEAAIAPALGVLREVERVRQRQRRVAAFDDGGEIEYRKNRHGANLGERSGVTESTPEV
jgi:hypothetical protein